MTDRHGPSSTTAPGDARSLALMAWIVAAVTILRVAVVFASPLELYPDEAQYWLWSREPAFGYFSKPPMLAWLIGLTTGVGGDAEGWIRLSSPLLHGGAALMLCAVGRRLYDARTGLWAGVLYLLMPGVSLSSGIASTDAPLMFFAAATLLAYVRFLSRPAMRLAILAGLGLGLAFLSKYAALYLLAGLSLHLVLSRHARQAWTPARAAAALGALALVMAPNMIWNALHDFSTVSHTAANANWNPANLFHPGEMLEFVLSQFMVLGPVPFALLLGATGLVFAARGRIRIREADLTMACFVAPPLVVVTLQALLSRANANWAGLAYAPAVVLVAAWLLRRPTRRLLAAAVASQLLIALGVVVLATFPVLADRIGAGGAFKRVRGWEEGAARIVDAARPLGPSAVIAVDDRFLFNSLAYYGRDALDGPNAPRLRMWVRSARAGNQAEASSPLVPDEGDRVLMASIETRYRGEFSADFRRFSGWRDASVRLDSTRTRDLALAVGEDFSPLPRDPLTGLPPSP